MCVCLYMFMYVDMYLCVHICLCVYVYMSACTPMCSLRDELKGLWVGVTLRRGDFRWEGKKFISRL